MLSLLKLKDIGFLVRKVRGNLFIIRNNKKSIDELLNEGFETSILDGELFYTKIISKVFSKTYLKYDCNGFLKEYGRIKNDIKDGWWYFLNLKECVNENNPFFIIEEGLFVNGLKEGKWLVRDFFNGEWINDGTIQEFKNGLLHGTTTVYGNTSDYGESFLLSETEFFEGKKHGKEIHYSSFDQIRKKGLNPIRIEYWEMGKFKYGTKFTTTEGIKIGDYFEEDGEI